MPIIIPKDMPSFSILHSENVFVMEDGRAIKQDIRPVEIAIVNLMPTKIETETQLIRALSNSVLQVNVTLVNTATYKSKNTSQTHLDKFYKTFDEIKSENFDGMIITGAPVENLNFNDVDYWDELKRIMDFADSCVTSTVFICWGAQAALYHYYGIEKKSLPKKLFGVFPNVKVVPNDPLLNGLDDLVYIPHSRYTEISEDDINRCKQLQTLVRSDKTGASIIRSQDGKRIFISGHLEYDRETLKSEYLRDIAKGIDINPPENYFADGEMSTINMNWASVSNLIFTNWLNYYVYQVTPFKLK